MAHRRHRTRIEEVVVNDDAFGIKQDTICA